MAGQFKSRFVAFLGFLVFLILIGFAIREFIDRRKIDREISGLEKEISTLENRNRELAGLISYFKTEDYRERQARTLLNMQKPGEFAVILPKNENDQPVSNAQEPTESNLNKWWKYFFGN